MHLHYLFRCADDLGENADFDAADFYPMFSHTPLTAFRSRQTQRFLDYRGKI
jgi:hypothetical protein